MVGYIVIPALVLGVFALLIYLSAVASQRWRKQVAEGREAARALEGRWRVTHKFNPGGRVIIIDLVEMAVTRPRTPVVRIELGHPSWAKAWAVQVGQQIELRFNPDGVDLHLDNADQRVAMRHLVLSETGG